MENKKIRWKLLKFMYLYSIILPGFTGLSVLFYPEILTSMFKFGNQDPYLFGITGSLWLSFGILAFFGFRSPLKYIPVLLMQLSYKVLWLSFIVLPLLIKGSLSIYEIVFALVMLSYVIGDLFAIPFKYFFSLKVE